MGCGYGFREAIRVKHLRGKGLNNCIFLSQWPCAESQLGLWKSTNDVGNINTAENNLLADEKGHWKKGEVIICIYFYTIGTCWKIIFNNSPFWRSTLLRKVVFDRNTGITQWQLIWDNYWLICGNYNQKDIRAIYIYASFKNKSCTISSPQSQGCYISFIITHSHCPIPVFKSEAFL